MGIVASSDEAAHEAFEREEYRTRRLAEFVYGITTAMVAVAGLLEHGEGVHPVGAAATIVAGAVAIWFAHAYSHLIGRRVRARRPFGITELVHELRASWPIVTAGLLVAVPPLLGVLGFWSLRTGLNIGNGVALAALAGLGVQAGRLSGEGWVPTLRLTFMTLAIGVFVVAIELIVHYS